MTKLKVVFILLFLILFSPIFGQEATERGNEQKGEPGVLVLDFAELAKDPSSTKLDLTSYVDYVYSGASGIVKPEDMIVDLGINN